EVDHDSAEPGGDMAPPSCNKDNEPDNDLEDAGCMHERCSADVTTRCSERVFVRRTVRARSSIPAYVCWRGPWDGEGVVVRARTVKLSGCVGSPIANCGASGEWVP